MPNRDIIKANLKNVVTETDLQGYNKLHVGKVRDTYEKDGKRIILEAKIGGITPAILSFKGR